VQKNLEAGIETLVSEIPDNAKLITSKMMKITDSFTILWLDDLNRYFNFLVAIEYYPAVLIKMNLNNSDRAWRVIALGHFNHRPWYNRF
jgi:hypothetical protein